MQDNNQNNHHWKSLLEDDTAFAQGELPATDIAWNRLYKKLHPGEKRQQLGYWSVAAAVFLMIMLSALLLYKKDHSAKTELVNAMPVIQKQKPIEENNQPQYSAGEQIKTAEIENHDAAVNTKRKLTVTNTKNQPLKQSAVADTTLGNAAENTQPALESMQNETVQENSNAVKEAVVVVKQKITLKVVHVNELGDATEKNSKPVEDYSVIQVGMKSQPVYNAPSAGGKIGLHIPTGKTSPSN